FDDDLTDDARNRLEHAVGDGLGKVVLNAGNFGELFAELRFERDAIEARSPMLLWEELHEELGVVRSFRLGGALGTADVGEDVRDLRHAEHVFTHPAHVRLRGLERDGRWKDRRDVETALVQLGKKLAAD